MDLLGDVAYTSQQKKKVDFYVLSSPVLKVNMKNFSNLSDEIWFLKGFADIISKTLWFKSLNRGIMEY